jgi:hypothetical protein
MRKISQAVRDTVGGQLADPRRLAREREAQIGTTTLVGGIADGVAATLALLSLLAQGGDRGVGGGASDPRLIAPRGIDDESGDQRQHARDEPAEVAERLIDRGQRVGGERRLQSAGS